MRPSKKKIYEEEEIIGTIEQTLSIDEAKELGLSIQTIEELEERNIED